MTTAHPRRHLHRPNSSMAALTTASATSTTSAPTATTAALSAASTAALKATFTAALSIFAIATFILATSLPATALPTTSSQSLPHPSTQHAPATALPASHPALSAQATLSTQSTPSADHVTVTVWSDSPELTDEDEAFLTAETEKLDFPDQVTTVDYLLLAHNSEDFNEGMLNFAKEQRPDLLNDGATKWAPGHLIVAVGLEPRRNGIYCGDDACAALTLNRGPRLHNSLEAMKPSLRGGNLAGGLFAGAQATIDPETLIGNTPDDDRQQSWFSKITALPIGILVPIGVVWLIFKNSRKNRKRDRKLYETITTGHAEIAPKLDEYDIRANSLRTDLADSELRHQWEEVRKQFLSIDSTLAKIPDNPSDKQLTKHGRDLYSANNSLSLMRNAMSNIDTLYDIENGDKATRIREAMRLREDFKEAALGTSNERFAEELTQLQARAKVLMDDPQQEGFVDAFTLLIADAAVVMKAIGAEELDGVTESAKHPKPTISADDWRPGVGYHGYTPYVVMSTWHSHDTASDNSWDTGDSSGVSVGYSTPGFSGGGGSSSW